MLFLNFAYATFKPQYAPKQMILSSPINQDHVNNPFIVVLTVFARLSAVALAYLKVAIFKQSLEVGHITPFSAFTREINFSKIN